MCYRDFSLPISYQTHQFISNRISPNTLASHKQAEKEGPDHVSLVKTSISLWTERWFLSSNAKDIGTLYLIFALFSGLIGTAFSVLIRLELSGPGVQYIADNQLYNSIITAHAILMIFFMVEKHFYIFNVKPQPSLEIGEVNNDNNDVVITGNDNNNNEGNGAPKNLKILNISILRF